ncbi:hypothetical protein [Haloarchaeobius sp. HRN-SO-5]|uniref:hypothetical protein n=1 Tax=Haloarchaeobius sp. HRN-SO-5 TaxID=3446118 RepID=UPI003EBCC74C
MPRSVRRGRVAAAAALALTLFVGRASAHGVRTVSSPIPTWLLLAGAAGAVGGTAVVLARTDVSPGGDPSDLTSVSATTGDAVRWLLRAVVAVAVGAAVVEGLTGPQARVTVTTMLVWPVWFKGALLVAAVVGNPWFAVAPWVTAYDLLARLEGDDPGLATYPDRLGRWPATLGFLFLVGLVENLTVVPARPSLTAALVAGYALAMVLGAVAFGREWFRRADPLGALYDLVGRVAPLAVRRRDDRYVVVRRPVWRAPAEPLPDAASVVLAVAAVYTVSFDGLVETPAYQRLLFDLADAGFGAFAGVATYVAGLVAFVALFRVVAAVATWAGRQRDAEADADADAGAVARSFGATLLPIAVAYDVAHNYPYVVENATVLARTMGPSLPSTTPGAGAYWASAVGLVVLGHLVAVVAAHLASTDLFGPDATLRGHAPLVALMVGYTVLSLWILSRPVGG